MQLEYSKTLVINIVDCCAEVDTNASKIYNIPAGHVLLQLAQSLVEDMADEENKLNHLLLG